MCSHGFHVLSIFGGAGNDNLRGQTGDDEIIGGAGTGLLRAGPGDDNLAARSGPNDTCEGEEGIRISFEPTEGCDVVISIPLDRRPVTGFRLKRQVGLSQLLWRGRY